MIETVAARITGRTHQDAVVAVNGGPIHVEADGSFHQNVVLVPGANTIEVVATDFTGQTAFESIVVFSVSPDAALPFSLFYSPDGLFVSEKTVTVEGATVPDAIVGINGAPVDTDALGGFFETIALQEGANLLELVATDFDDNLRFESVVVFYIP